jgi:hypothetical protein
MPYVGLIMICCGMAVKRLGMLGVRVRNALAVKMETVTLTGKGK